MSGQHSSQSGSVDFGSTGGSQGAGVEDVKEAAKQTAQETKDAALETAEQIKGDVQAQASEIAGEAKQHAGEMIGQAKDQATNAFTQQREQAVSGLGSLADALRSTAQSLKESNDGAQAGIGQFVDDAAERLTQSADFLRDKDASQLLHDVQDFARKQPLAFVGAAFGVGIVAARLLKGTSSGSQAIDQAMSSVSAQAVNAMDTAKERIAGAAGSSDHGRGPRASDSGRRNETASDVEAGRSSGRSGTGRKPTETSEMPTGATAGYAPEVDGMLGREGRS